MRRRAQKEEDDERRRLEEELAKHQVRRYFPTAIPMSGVSGRPLQRPMHRLSRRAPCLAEIIYARHSR